MAKISLYAGIGSRKTPKPILDIMRWFAMTMGEKGVMLRTGGADGADAAFFEGVKQFDYPYDIIRPEHATREARRLASQFIPHWNTLNEWGKNAHGRNAMIVLGHSLAMPVDLVVCWTPNGFPIGGTATGILIAKNYEIPIINLAVDPVQALIDLTK